MSAQRTSMQARRPGRPPALAAGTARFLLGDWIMTRVVRDFRAGRPGAFRGRASFTPRPATGGALSLRYAEQGELSFGGHRGPASRTLRYLERPDGAADVRFADGREFYLLDLRSGRWEAAHQCGPDRYQVSVQVRGGDCFEEAWRVTGPAKDYQLTATYVRTGGQQ